MQRRWKCEVKLQISQKTKKKKTKAINGKMPAWWPRNTNVALGFIGSWKLRWENLVGLRPSWYAAHLWQFSPFYNIYYIVSEDDFRVRAGYRIPWGRSMTQYGVAGAEARWAVEPQWKISIVVWLLAGPILPGPGLMPTSVSLAL